MPRNITVTFDDGSSHVYENAPDNLTPDAVTARAQKDFGKAVTALDGGRGGIPTGRRGVDQIPGYGGAVPAAQTKERGFFETIGAPINAATEGIISGGGNVMFGGQQLLGMGLQKVGAADTGRALIENAARLRAESQARVAPFKQEFPLSTGAGELGAEVLATTPVTRGLGAVVGAVAPAFGRAISTGGFSTKAAPTSGARIIDFSARPATPTKLGDFAARVGGGAVAGGATAGIINTDDALMGAGVGAAIPVGAAVVSPVIKGTTNFFKPGKLIDKSLADAMNNDPALMMQVKSLLDQGYSIQDVAAITKSSGLAAFVNKSKGASNAVTDLYNRIDDALAATQKNQLAQAQQNVNALTQRNLPVATASPTQPRRDVMQSLADEAAALQGKQTAMTGQLTAQQQAQEAALAAQRQSVEGGIANVSQLEVGQALSKSAQEGLENTRRTVIEPAYTKAFNAAPDATINVSGVAGVAKEQQDELLTQLKGLAPQSSALLQKYGPRQVETMVQGVPVSQMVPPPPITLQQAHEIRQAINIERAALKGSNESGANIARTRLNELYTSLNDAIERGVAPEARKLFSEANDLFKERIINVYRTGQPSNLSLISTLNEPMLRPGDVVSKAMADEGSTLQFLKVFKQDAAAMQNLQTGIEDLYRQQVLAGGKAATPAAHAKFMFDYQKQLRALDSAGMSMTDSLEKIGGQIKSVSAAEEALAAQGKAIPSKVAAAFKAEDEALKQAASALGFRQTDKLRAAIVSDPAVAGQALARMSTGAKSSLARGVMQDAGAAADPFKYLVANEQGVMRVLNAHNPKTAAATFAAAKDAAELANIIRETGNKLGVKFSDNAALVQRNLNNLTQGLPDVQKAVQQIQQQIQRGEDFSKLAVQGDANVLNLFSKETKPHMFPLNKVWAIANAVLNKVEGKLDKKLAVQIATELANPNTAATAVERAMATKTARPVNLPGLTRGAAALTASPEKQNALAP